MNAAALTSDPGSSASARETRSPHRENDLTEEERVIAELEAQVAELRSAPIPVLPGDYVRHKAGSIWQVTAVHDDARVTLECYDPADAAGEAVGATVRPRLDPWRYERIAPPMAAAQALIEDHPATDGRERYLMAPADEMSVCMDPGGPVGVCPVTLDQWTVEEIEGRGWQLVALAQAARAWARTEPAVSAEPTAR